jgi:hypothetical protein
VITAQRLTGVSNIAAALRRHDRNPADHWPPAREDMTTLVPLCG